MKATIFDASEAFGLWKDREELRDVSGYVRTLRQGRFRDLGRE